MGKRKAKKTAATRKSKQNQKRKLQTLAEVAHALDLSERTVAGYVARGCPKPPIDLQAVEKWRAANIKTKLRPVPGDASDLLLKQDIAKLCEQIKLLRRKNAAAEAQLLSRSVVAGEIAAHVVRILCAIEQMPAALVEQLPKELHASVQQRLTTRCELIRKEALNATILERPVSDWILDAAAEIATTRSSREAQK